MQIDSLNTTQHTSVILGLGRTGLSCLEYLHSKQNLIACDDNISVQKQKELQIKYAQVEFLSVAECLQRQDVSEVIASPGISDQHPLIAQALRSELPVVCDIEVYAKAETSPVIAVTGTNGKSTVVSWLQHVLTEMGRESILAGNIGIPALAVISDEHDCSVLELSSFQLERTFSLAPHAALILNLSSDHLDRYSDEKEYQIAKERIYQNAHIALINRDAQKFTKPSSVKRFISFGLSKSKTGFGVVTENNQRYLSYQNKALVATDQLPLIGEHNVSNALAVLACALAVDIDPNQTIEALLSFNGLPHRTEFIANINGVRYINDSKATNAGATIAAVNGDLENIVLIAGGDAKQAELESLKTAFTGKLKAAILLGQDATQLISVLDSIAKCFEVESIEQAVAKAAEISVPGDTVLLSPACSSLDMFSSYVQRGEYFVNAVEGLQHG